MRTKTNNKKSMTQVLGVYASGISPGIVVLVLTLLDTKGGET